MWTPVEPDATGLQKPQQTEKKQSKPAKEVIPAKLDKMSKQATKKMEKEVISQLFLNLFFFQSNQKFQISKSSIIVEKLN